MRTLGQELKHARELHGFTLRQVEEAISISNAYLSQLENDKIKKPSANALYKLASLYNVDMEVFLYASGLIKEKPANKSKVLSASIRAQMVTSEEEEKLLDFLKYLRFSAK